MLDKFVRRNVADIMMFTWVNCFRVNFPAVSVEKAIQNFMKHMGLHEDTYNSETAKKKYYRMDEEFRDMQKANHLK